MRLHATTLVALAAVAAAATTGQAANAAPGVPARFHATLAPNSVIITLDHADFVPAAGRAAVDIHDEQGTVVSTVPSTMQIDQHRFPVAAQISPDRRTLTLTPDLGAVRAAGPSPVASPFEEQLALNDLTGDLSTNMTVGSIAGMLVGAVVGAGLGLGSCLITGPGCLVILPAAVTAFAAGGGVAGTLVGGAATLADSGWRYLLTVQSPPGQSPYANSDGLQDPGGAGAPNANLRLPSGSGDAITTGSGAIG
ncbi:hypothetical protein [Nocardia lijiangensis]|uniref:hypothetical protein n=1 Tax=Nocardia lijiangensis TaxID=299618 RepID=UPI003D704A02